MHHAHAIGSPPVHRVMTVLPHLRPEPPSPPRALHRLARVRCQERITQRTVARRLGLNLTDVRRQESSTTDLPLSVLYQWQGVLDVPITELLIEPGDALSQPIKQRAQLVRLMKTARTIAERCRKGTVSRLAETLIGQLLDLMPELQEVGPWHAIGRRRTRHELGRIAERSLPDDLFLQSSE